MLKGVTFFLADLARGIKVPFIIDYLDLKRYAGAQPSDRVRIARDIDYPIAGQHVLIVEDIVNTGLTLDYVLSELREREPASIEIVTLLDRPLVAPIVGTLWYFGMLPGPLALLFAIEDSSSWVWTLLIWRAEQRDKL